jgi:DNA-binding response OmpR family regulator
MDGWQFRAEQRRLTAPHLAAIPVLILTSAADVDPTSATLNAAAVVEKPFDPDRLLSAVRAVLHH